MDNDCIANRATGPGPGPTAPARVAVFRTGHLGDTVCAIPAFRLVRQAFPAAELTLLCDRPARPLVAPADVVAPLGVFDRVRSYPSRRGWRSALQGLACRLHIIGQLSDLWSLAFEAAAGPSRKLKAENKDGCLL